MSSSEYNKLKRMTIKLGFLKSDIGFLKDCKKFKVFPKFMCFKCPITNCRTKRVEKYGKRMWLTSELSFLYAKLSLTELEAYNLHLKLVKNMGNMEYELFLLWYRNLRVVCRHKWRTKNRTLKEKLNRLRKKHTSKLKKQVENTNVDDEKQNNTNNEIDKLVYNKSDIVLESEEYDLLKKGLNFALPARRNPTNDVIVDVETSIKFNATFPGKQLVRCLTEKLIKNELVDYKISDRSAKHYKILDGLKKKDCVFTKADKGNAVVILNKGDYFEGMNLHIKESAYIEIKKNPLLKLIRESTAIIKSCILEVFPKLHNLMFRNSNPTLPRMYGLPKIHKEGNKFRPIVSNTGSPTEKISKWLVSEFKNLSPPEGFSVDNSLGFINSLQDVTLNEDERLISFDVTSLFPSVPLDITIDMLKRWLESELVPTEKITSYVKLTEHCIQNNYFQFQDKFYKQTKGLAMGNPLSPFLANLFLSCFELELTQFALFPRVWSRYVDDVFAIVKIGTENQILELLNSQYTSIQFTMEFENNKKSLPFLDLLLTRGNDNKLEYDVYRKNTSTFAYIPSDSNHNSSHKYSAFNSMVYRLLNVPLTEEKYDVELRTIKEIAKSNGYSCDVIDRMVKNAERKLNLKNATTLLPIENRPPTRRTSVYFHNSINNKLKSIFKQADLELVNKNRFKLRNLLGSTKDKLPVLSKSGIYEIGCNDCPQTYIGQTRRSVITRYKEHEASTRLNHKDKSAIASHMMENNHSFDIKQVSLRKEVMNPLQLDAWETLYMLQSKNLMNLEETPLKSFLLESAIKV